MVIAIAVSDVDLYLFINYLTFSDRMKVYAQEKTEQNRTSRETITVLSVEINIYLLFPFSTSTWQINVNKMAVMYIKLPFRLCHLLSCHSWHFCFIPQPPLKMHFTKFLRTGKYQWMILIWLFRTKILSHLLYTQTNYK